MKRTEKPTLSPAQKATRLAFCLWHCDTDWKDIILTNESYFETGALRRCRARGVLRRAGETFLPQNLNCKFPKGATIMFGGAIMYGYKGVYLYTSRVLLETSGLSTYFYV